jgi:hypothetical protein
LLASGCYVSFAADDDPRDVPVDAGEDAPFVATLDDTDAELLVDLGVPVDRDPLAACRAWCRRTPCGTAAPLPASTYAGCVGDCTNAHRAAAEGGCGEDFVDVLVCDGPHHSCGVSAACSSTTTELADCLRR